MKVFITKFALTKGIIETEGEICRHGMIDVRCGYFDDYYTHPDWYISKFDAIKRAEIMKDKKIASLNTQIDKLNTMNFDETTTR